MVKIGLVVVVCVMGIGLAHPMVEEPTESAVTKTEGKQLPDIHHLAVAGRQGGLAGILGSIGNALVPIFGALLGPIFSNLAQGIASAFSDGLNISTNKFPSAEAQALLVRIPTNSPLYAALVQGQLISPDNQEDLPSVTNARPGKTPFKLTGKFGNEPAPVDDAEPILIHAADVPEPPASAVKRTPQRKRPETGSL